MKFSAKRSMQMILLCTQSATETEDIVEVSLPEFVKLSKNFEVIPQNRIVFVKKSGQILYRKHGN